MNKTVFIDRDDTLCKDVGYCSRPEDLELFPGAGEGIKLINDNGFKVVVITNQSGIARGYFNEETLKRIHEKMKNDLAVYGAHVDAIYYCPHHPDDGCECRKPAPKMGLQAIQDMDINPSKSFVIGDRLMDILFARNLGCRAILISNPKGLEELQKAGVCADYVASNLEEAAEWILEQV